MWYLSLIIIILHTCGQHPLQNCVTFMYTWQYLQQQQPQHYFIAQMLMELSKYLTQISKRNRLSNSTGRRQTSRLFTNAKGFELRSTEKQLQLLARVDCSRGLPADCKSSAVTSRPCCLKPRFMCTIAILNDCFIHFF